MMSTFIKSSSERPFAFDTKRLRFLFSRRISLLSWVRAACKSARCFSNDSIAVFDLSVDASISSRAAAARSSTQAKMIYYKLHCERKCCAPWSTASAIGSKRHGTRDKHLRIWMLWKTIEQTVQMVLPTLLEIHL